MSFDNENKNNKNNKKTMVYHQNVLPDCAREFGEIKMAIKNLDEKNDEQNKKLDRLTDCILGNGKIGLSTKVSKLEDADNGRKWFVRVCLVGALTVIGKWIWVLIATAA